MNFSSNTLRQTMKLLSNTLPRKDDMNWAGLSIIQSRPRGHELKVFITVPFEKIGIKVS